MADRAGPGKKAGFDEAMLAGLAADETPVNVLDRSAPARAPEEKDEPDPEEKDGKAAAGAPHVLITRTPEGRLTFLQAIGYFPQTIGMAADLRRLQ